MAASPLSEPHNLDVSAEQPWIGSRFTLNGSDIEFKSSDGFVFHLHRSVLGVTTGAFPGSDSDMPTHGEIVPLSEPANVLAILFAFLYPKPSPDLHGMGFDLLLAIAEAAAKYEVLRAVEICNERLPSFLPDQAPAILDHAIKHDYQRLLAQTLPYFTTKPLPQTLKRLRPQYIIPFAQYQEIWRSAFKDLTQVALAYKVVESRSCNLGYNHICTECRGTVFVAIAYLESIASVDALCETLLHPDQDTNFPKMLRCCQYNGGHRCVFLLEMIKTCSQKIDNMPSFATFLGLKV